MICTSNISTSSGAASLSFSNGVGFVDNSKRYELRWDANPYAQLAFVDRAGDSVLWSHVTQTAVKEPAKLTLTQFGNLRLTDAYGNLLWASNTTNVGQKPYCLHIVDGNLLVVDSKNSTTWIAPQICPGGPEQRIKLTEWAQCGGTRCGLINRERNLPCENGPLPYSCCPTGWQCLPGNGSNPEVWQCQPTRALDMCTLGPAILPAGQLCGGFTKCGFDGVCGGVCCKGGTYCLRESDSKRVCTALPPIVHPPRIDLGTWRYQGPPNMAGASLRAAMGLTSPPAAAAAAAGKVAAGLTSPTHAPSQTVVKLPPAASQGLGKSPPPRAATQQAAKGPSPAAGSAAKPPPPKPATKSPPPQKPAAKSPPPQKPAAKSPPPQQQQQQHSGPQRKPPPAKSPPIKAAGH
jgi:hypothetical protein